MKNPLKPEALRRDYFHRLFTDRSVEDKMQFFTRAKRIFDLLQKKKRRKKQ